MKTFVITLGLVLLVAFGAVLLYATPKPQSLRTNLSKLSQPHSGDEQSYPYDQIVAFLPPNAALTLAADIASSTGGSVLSCDALIIACTIQVPAATPAQLDAIISKLRANPRFSTVIFTHNTPATPF